ncbi:MAG: dinitrogenase iron-molybdenum cofactor biosynthesis protein [Lachnospiraceae bacterium]|nr:dinitrogenase iron-molybdenum cofactor biosynthesis protein [Lachnospiraceae bacterium]
MVVAATYKDGNIFQHFGTTPQFKIYRVEEGTIAQEIVDTTDTGHEAMAKFLIDRGVNALICDDIGAGAYKLLDDNNIEIYAGYSDPADVCMVAYMHGNLVRATSAVCQGHEGEEECMGECGNCHCGGDCGDCHW